MQNVSSKIIDQFVLACMDLLEIHKQSAKNVSFILNSPCIYNGSFLIFLYFKILPLCHVQLAANEMPNVHSIKHVLEIDHINAKTHVHMSHVESTQNARSKIIEKYVFVHLNTLVILTEDADLKSACPIQTA